MMIPGFGEKGVIDLKSRHVHRYRPADRPRNRRSGHPLDADRRRRHGHVGSAFKEGMTVVTHNNTKGLVRAYRRTQRQAVLDVPHDSKEGRAGLRDLGKRLGGLPTATPECGRNSRSIRSWVWCICRSNRRLRIITAASGRATICIGESLVCVELKTGKMKWYFQIVHHPIWDYDLSSAPILANINVGGKAH